MLPSVCFSQFISLSLAVYSFTVVSPCKARCYLNLLQCAKPLVENSTMVSILFKGEQYDAVNFLISLRHNDLKIRRCATFVSTSINKHLHFSYVVSANIGKHRLLLQLEITHLEIELFFDSSFESGLTEVYTWSLNNFLFATYYANKGVWINISISY